MSTQAVSWPGKSGNKYTFNVYQMSGEWNALPGLYIFSKELTPGYWKALYVGETGSFKTRITRTHDEWPKAVALGATHVHAMVNHSGDSGRKQIESDLILQLQPPLNQKVSFGLNPFLSR
jgi:hypothetical protein